MNRVVITGIGFVHPAGIGSSADELDFSSLKEWERSSLGDAHSLYTRPLPEYSAHRFYPDRKTCRYLRPEATTAIIACSLALESANLTSIDHTDTAFFCACGQCYGDMWPHISTGIQASLTDGQFDMTTFGMSGHTRIYPFFAVRTLAALPMAIVAEKFGIHGENSVISSFGAESAEPLQQALAMIQSGEIKRAIVCGFDLLEKPVEMENLYHTDLYDGPIFGSSAAGCVILENCEIAQNRNAHIWGELTEVEMISRSVIDGNGINYFDDLFNLFSSNRNSFEYVHLSGSGTQENFKAEWNAALTHFPSKHQISSFESSGTTLAATEPFGMIQTLLVAESGSRCCSLSRSLNGTESALFFTAGDRNA